MFRCPDVLAVLDFSPAKLLELFLRQRCIRATCSHCLHHSGHCFIQEAFALCQVDDVSDSQNRILGSVVFWMYDRASLFECVQVICYRNLSGRLDLQEITQCQGQAFLLPIFSRNKQEEIRSVKDKTFLLLLIFFIFLNHI